MKKSMRTLGVIAGMACLGLIFHPLSQGCLANEKEGESLVLELLKREVKESKQPNLAFELPSLHAALTVLSEASTGKAKEQSSQLIMSIPLPAWLKAISTKSLGMKLKQDDVFGVHVMEVNSGSLAETAGLEPGDILFVVNGLPTADVSSLFEATQRTTDGRFEFAGYSTSKKRPFLVTIPAKSSDESFATFKTRSALWLQQGLQFDDVLLKRLAATHNTEIFKADFLKGSGEAVKDIQRWFEKGDKTEQLFQQPVELTISDKTTVLLATTSTFRSSWAFPFNPKRTKSGMFTEGMKEHKVNYMHRFFDGKEGILFVKDAILKAAAIELSVNNPNVGIVFILPDSESDVATLLNGLDMKAVTSLIKKMKDGKKQNVHVKLPRFKVSHAGSLKEHFKAMGLRAPFENAGSFLGAKEPMKIAELSYGCSIECDEMGFKVSGKAVVETAIIGGNEFNVSRPFVFLVWEREASTVLAAGVIRQPTE